MATIQLAPVHTRLLKSWTDVAHANLASSPHTGDTAMFTLASPTLPGGSMGPNGRCRITALWGFTGTAGTRTIAVNFGATQVWIVGSIAAATLSIIAQINIVNRNSQAAQIVSPAVVAGYGSSISAAATPAIDTASDVTIAIRGQLASAADSETLEAYLIEVLYGA